MAQLLVEIFHAFMILGIWNNGIAFQVCMDTIKLKGK